jgi:hypothetical protein
MVDLLNSEVYNIAREVLSRKSSRWRQPDIPGPPTQDPEDPKERGGHEGWNSKRHEYVLQDVVVRLPIRY